MLKTLKQKWLFIYANNWYLLIFLAFLACLGEFFFFNASRLYLSSYYPYKQITLPQNDNLKSPGVVISPQSSSITINNLDLYLKNVAFKTQGPNVFVTGSAYFTGDNFKYQPQKVSDFAFNPGSDDFNTVLTKVRGRGKVNSVTLTFTNLQQTGASFYITELHLNKDPDLHFYFLRVLVIFAFVGSVLFSIKYRLYAVPFEWSKKRHRAAFFALVGIMLLAAFALARSSFSDGANPITYTYYANAGSFPISGGAGKYFAEMPATQDDVVRSDMYVRLMDAFSKGHLYIDYPVDGRFMSLDNPWDYSERMVKKVFGIYDVVYHDGHYYIYPGLSPLLIYYPIYWLTGQPPLSNLAVSICAILMMLSLAMLYRQAFKVFEIKTNVIFFLTGFATLGIGAGTYFYLAGPDHGKLAYQMSAIFSCLCLSCLLNCIHQPNSRLRLMLLISAGVCTVLIVMSRPLDVVICFLLSLVFLYFYMRDPLNSGLKNKLADAAAIGIPICLGAMFVMLYNYGRFEDIFEFGNFKQVTFNNTGAPFAFDLQNISNWLWHYYLEDAVLIKDFPFIAQRIAAHSGYENYGTFVYCLIDGFGILEYSIVYAFALLSFKKDIFCSGPKGRMLFWTALIVIPISLILSLGNWRIVGLAARYVIEQQYILILFAVLLTCTVIKWGQLLSSRALYFAALAAMAKTCFMGSLMVFKDDMLYKVNPDFYLYLRDFFSPFVF